MDAVGEEPGRFTGHAGLSGTGETAAKAATFKEE